MRFRQEVQALPRQADLTRAKPEIVVAAGIVSNAVGDVLIAQRLKGAHMAGWWEFPGGKLEAHETPCDALVRELREELGIEVSAAEALLTYAHDYPEQVVHLHVLRVTAYSGEPAGLEGQPLRWVAADQLMEAGVLPADLPIVEALRGLP